ncbi:TPA: hypothetical protein RFY66_002067, partial [Listeria monocytogenes]|nr:hypothetical protein [Listeria monocytogenes]
MRKLDFSYNNANYNAEFLMKILTTLKDITKVEQFTIEIIDAVPNDQEQFKEEKDYLAK